LQSKRNVDILKDGDGSGVDQEWILYGARLATQAAHMAIYEVLHNA